MSQALADPLTITRRSLDPRADGACRVVSVSPSAVIIERSVSGVRMRIGVPMAAYRGLVIAARQPSGQATLMLRHEDPDLGVDLGSGDALDVARSARAWSQLTGHTIAVEAAAVVVGASIPRRSRRVKRAPQADRRSSFARRRRVGSPKPHSRIFAGEREIIARD